ncbi:MAG: hypothetical protein NW241_11755 [Bacteroidia bacterium]|nr:hypothetical protein [Bacteroidia bacterium]
MNGSALEGGSCYRLNSVGSKKYGTAVWVDGGLSLASLEQAGTITMDFEVFLGYNDAGGHGMAFVMHQGGTAAIGGGGPRLGYAGPTAIFPSVAVEIDTRVDSYEPVPANTDHLSVHFDGNEQTFPVAPVLLPNLEDGLYHQLTIEWRYDQLIPAQSSLTATIDGLYSITANFDPAAVFNSLDPVIMGFSGGVNKDFSNFQYVSLLNGGPGSCSFLFLPVELVAFNAELQENNAVDLVWATASELNNDYFEVLRSADGLIWQTLDVVDGAGTTSSFTEYRAQDLQPLSGTNYYRLRQVDTDGAYTLSQTVEVFAGQASRLEISARPNPAVDALNLHLVLPEAAPSLRVEVRDVRGALMYETVLEADAPGAYTLAVPAEAWPAGVYVVRAATGTSQSVTRVSVR